MHFVKNSNIVQEATQQFLQPHPCHYSLAPELLPIIASYPQLTLQHSQLATAVTIRGQKVSNQIKLHLIRNSNNMENCIIYLHGLGSYCMEAKFLVQKLGGQFSLCMFDSRAHGKNKSNYVTYGLLQSQELAQIIAEVVSLGYNNIVLWGRSMGAVTALRFLQQEKHSQLAQHVQYVVADAPFSSFKSIATDIVSKATHLPNFLSLILADTFAQKIKVQFGLDLREIDLSNLSTPVPVYFLYSSKDELMGQKHLDSIMKTFRGSCDISDVGVRHNDQRPAWVTSKIMTKIQEHLYKGNFKHIALKKRGLSITKAYMKILQPKVSQVTDDITLRHSVECYSKIQRRTKPQTVRVLKENIQVKKCLDLSFRVGPSVSISKSNRTTTHLIPPPGKRVMVNRGLPYYFP